MIDQKKKKGSINSSNSTTSFVHKTIQKSMNFNNNSNYVNAFDNKILNGYLLKPYWSALFVSKNNVPPDDNNNKKYQVEIDFDLDNIYFNG